MDSHKSHFLDTSHDTSTLSYDYVAVLPPCLGYEHLGVVSLFFLITSIRSHQGLFKAKVYHDQISSLLRYPSLPGACLVRLLEYFPTSALSCRAAQDCSLGSPHPPTRLLLSIGSLLSHQSPLQDVQLLTQKNPPETVGGTFTNLPLKQLYAVASDNCVQTSVQSRRLVGNVQTDACRLAGRH